MKINLVIQSYGSIREYKRAIFSIWSFCTYCNKPEEDTQVVLFTDQPAFFDTYLQGITIKYVELTPNKIATMRGAIDFVHRVKICVIEEALEMLQDSIIYIDSDTFFVKSPVFYFSQINEKNSFMHINEYQFSAMSTFKLPAGQIFRTFYEFVVDRDFRLPDDTAIKVRKDQISWNAGVILLHYSHKKLLPNVFCLTDSFYSKTKNHGCEQYAFSIILDSKTNLNSCEDMVYHYWLPVKKLIADKFLANRIDIRWADKSWSEKISDTRKWTQELPHVFERDVLMLRYNAIQAFNEGLYKKGYLFSIRAFLKDPINLEFYSDVAYHTGKFLKSKISFLWL